MTKESPIENESFSHRAILGERACGGTKESTKYRYIYKDGGTREERRQGNYPRRLSRFPCEMINKFSRAGRQFNRSRKCNSILGDEFLGCFQ